MSNGRARPRSGSPAHGGARALLGVALAAVVAAPAGARAGESAHRAIALTTATGDLGRLAPPAKGARSRGERARQRRLISPCGRHVLEVSRGAVFIDERRIHPARGTIDLLAPPTWRRDGRAVAWIERDRGGEIRLIVIPEIGARVTALPWQLAAVARGDRVFWAAANRVVVGPRILAPRAVASWDETVVR